MAEVGEPLGRHAMLAGPHLHRIARHETDRGEGQEHQRQKGRDGQRDAAKEVGEHGRSETNGPRLASWRAEPGPASLKVDALERMCAKRTLLVAYHV